MGSRQGDVHCTSATTPTSGCLKRKSCTPATEELVAEADFLSLRCTCAPCLSAASATSLSSVDTHTDVSLLQSSMGCSTQASSGNPAITRTFFRGTLMLPPRASTSPQTWLTLPADALPLPSIFSHLFPMPSPSSLCCSIFCCCGRPRKDRKEHRDENDLRRGLSEAAPAAPSTGRLERIKDGFLSWKEAGARHDDAVERLGKNGELNYSFEMAEGRRKRLLELVKQTGNGTCAECAKKNPDWGSFNIGVFICKSCAGFHRNLGAHISKVKSLVLDNWDGDQFAVMEEVGNLKAKAKYEMYLPVCYRKPVDTDPDVLKEQFIRAKYEREEFIHVDRQHYTSGTMEGSLWKRGKEEGTFRLRKFVLSEIEGTLKYYVKETHKEPKATIEVAKLNMTFCPKKVGNPNGAQITYVRDGSTRNIFIYSSSGSDIVDWYMAIRSVKLNKLLVAYPGTSELELSQYLTRDFLKEGWMFKTGPRSSDAYKWRWFTLDDRKLMYMEDPLDPYPKGEIFLGYHGDGFAVKKGVPPGMKEQGFGFTLRTRDRVFLFGVQRDEDRLEWMKVLQSVIDRPLTPQDNTMAANLVRKRSTFNSPLHILKVR